MAQRFLHPCTTQSAYKIEEQELRPRTTTNLESRVEAVEGWWKSGEIGGGGCEVGKEDEEQKVQRSRRTDASSLVSWSSSPSPEAPSTVPEGLEDMVWSRCLLFVSQVFGACFGTRERDHREGPKRRSNDSQEERAR